MHTINMPGFTAETSIYTSPVSYRSMPAGRQGEGTAVIPAIGGIHFPCFGSSNCGACIPSGPTIFSPGRQFCINTDCQPTIHGGCKCRVTFKGFVPCQPFGTGGVFTTKG